MKYRIRPDRVYATSVWAPTTQGYQPVRNMMNTARDFTQVWDPSGRGLANAMNPGFFGRIKNWWQQKKVPKICVCPIPAPVSVVPDTSPTNGIVPRSKTLPNNTGIVPPGINPDVITKEKAGLAITQNNVTNSPPLQPSGMAAIQTNPNAALYPADLSYGFTSGIESDAVRDGASLLSLNPFYKTRTPGSY